MKKNRIAIIVFFLFLSCTINAQIGTVSTRSRIYKSGEIAINNDDVTIVVINEGTFTIIADDYTKTYICAISMTYGNNNGRFICNLRDDYSHDVYITISKDVYIIQDLDQTLYLEGLKPLKSTVNTQHPIKKKHK
jgi:hypothetical protein